MNATLDLGWDTKAIFYVAQILRWIICTANYGKLRVETKPILYMYPVASIPPNLKSKSGASSPPPPLLSSSIPLPFKLRSFPASPPWLHPLLFPTLLPYALSPFSSTFPPPILVPSSPPSQGAPHPAKESSQPSSVSSPSKSRPTNALWTA